MALGDDQRTPIVISATKAKFSWTYLVLWKDFLTQERGDELREDVLRHVSAIVLARVNPGQYFSFDTSNAVYKLEYDKARPGYYFTDGSPSRAWLYEEEKPWYKIAVDRFKEKLDSLNDITQQDKFMRK